MIFLKSNAISKKARPLEHLRKNFVTNSNFIWFYELVSTSVCM